MILSFIFKSKFYSPESWNKLEVDQQVSSQQSFCLFISVTKAPCSAWTLFCTNTDTSPAACVQLIVTIQQENQAGSGVYFCSDR